jgi:hypothetical protein
MKKYQFSLWKVGEGRKEEIITLFCHAYYYSNQTQSREMKSKKSIFLKNRANLVKLGT